MKVLITGAASGIGAATARVFAERGATVVLVDRNGDGAARIAKSIDGGAHHHQVDLRDDGEVAALFTRVAADLGEIDVLVANAGIATRESPLVETTETETARVIDVNLHGTLRTLRHGVPTVADGGAVVITASTSGLIAHPGSTVYAATKIALVGVARSLAAELIERRIRVNAVCPGGIDTPLVQATYPDDAAVAFPRWWETSVAPIGKPSEVAEAIVFLATAAHVNGTALRVDGGDAIRGSL